MSKCNNCKETGSLTVPDVFQCMHCSMLAGKPESNFSVLMQIQSFATFVPVISSIKSNLSIKSFGKPHGTKSHFTR